MCLIAFAIDAHPSVPLLIASNRDEFFERPTAPMHRWALPNGVEVIGGRDLRDGGTWLGANAQGRIAMLTNVRSAQMDPAPRSRGELTSRWLAHEMDWAALLESLSPADYGGFNLVVGDVQTGFWGWVSNRDPAKPHASDRPMLHSRPLPPGLYGLSNATLDTAWPKTLKLKQALADAMRNDADWRALLLSALGDTRPAPEDQLPASGVPGAWEAALSSPFVRLPERGYGTRSSLLMRALREPASQGALGWTLALEEWTHGKDPAQQAAWLSEQRQAEVLHW